MKDQGEGKTPVYVDEVLENGRYKVRKSEKGKGMLRRGAIKGVGCEEATMTTPFSTQQLPASTKYRCRQASALEQSHGQVHAKASN